MKDFRKSTVYAIRCELNGKVYVGCTVELEQRLRAHMCALRNGHKLQSSPQWQNDYDGFGEDAFQAYVLETDVPWAKRSERENYWIERFHATDPSYGYNNKRENPGRRLKIMEGLPPVMGEDEDHAEN